MLNNMQQGDWTLFRNRESSMLRLLFIIPITFIIITLDHKSDTLQGARSVLATMVYPVQVIVDTPFKMARSVSERLQEKSLLMENYREVREENLRLKTRLSRYEDIRSENSRLRRLLSSAARPQEEVLVAELISVDQAATRQRIVLDKGMLNGVRIGLPVLNAEGIIGQVDNVTPFTSTVLLISDAEHALPVEIKRTGQRGVVVGGLENHRLELINLPNNTDIRVGDEVRSSGLGGRFPRGYIVGQVVSILKETGQPFVKVLVKPQAKMEQIREVLLVTNYKSNSNLSDQPL